MPSSSPCLCQACPILLLRCAAVGSSVGQELEHRRIAARCTVCGHHRIPHQPILSPAHPQIEQQGGGETSWLAGRLTPIRQHPAPVKRHGTWSCHPRQDKAHEIRNRSNHIHTSAKFCRQARVLRYCLRCSLVPRRAAFPKLPSLPGYAGDQSVGSIHQGGETVASVSTLTVSNTKIFFSNLLRQWPTRPMALDSAHTES